MVVFYVETNFLMSIATGREPEAIELLSNLPSGISLTTPQICMMEALVVLQQERRERKSFADLLDRHIRQLERDTTSSHAATLLTLLNSARIENNELFADINARLFDAIELMSHRAEMIGLNAHMLEANRKDAFIEDPTDNLILHCILNHARANPGSSKAFMSNNRKDFGTKPVQDALQAAGIGKYVVETKQFLGWYRSQPAS
jgi:predicted nucleic acid-binding protein